MKLKQIKVGRKVVTPYGRQALVRKLVKVETGRPGRPAMLVQAGGNLYSPSELNQA